MNLPEFEEIHIENTNSCGYRCSMCPREKQTRKLGYMSLDDFSFLLDRIGPFTGNFHLHGFGEPLLDRLLPQKVKLLKEKSLHAKAQLFTTLGVRVKDDLFQELALSGLDTMGISFYGFTQDEYKRVHGFDGLDLAKKNLVRLSEAMKHPKSKLRAILKIPAVSLSSSLPIAPSPEKEAFCSWAKSLGFQIKQWSYVHNYGNGRDYNAPNEEKLCPVLNGRRKKILNITWDLKVIPCCYDFNATIPFGDLKEKSLQEIFSGPEYLQFWIAHQTGDLSHYPVCQTCEKRDYE